MTARLLGSSHWPLVRDVLAFLVGAFMLIWETIFVAHPSTVIVVAGIAALGVTGSGVTQRWLRAMLNDHPETDDNNPD